MAARRSWLPLSLLIGSGGLLWAHIYERGVNSQKQSSSLFKGLMFRLGHHDQVKAMLGSPISYQFMPTSHPWLPSSSPLQSIPLVKDLLCMTVYRNSIHGTLNNVLGRADIQFHVFGQDDKVAQVVFKGKRSPSGDYWEPFEFTVKCQDEALNLLE